MEAIKLLITVEGENEVIIDCNMNDNFANVKSFLLLIKTHEKYLNYGFMWNDTSFIPEKEQLSEYALFIQSKAKLTFALKRRLPKLAEKENAKINSKKNQKSFLELIEKKKCDKILTELKKQFDPNFISEHGETPLTLAITNNDKEIFETLIANGAVLDFRRGDGKTPLHVAAQTCKPMLLASLLRFGVWSEVEDIQRLTPLYLACLSNNTECVLKLLQFGASPNAVDLNERFALHIACNSSNDAITSMLMEYGANIDAGNSAGNTPLHVAVASNAKTCVKMLLKAGCKKDQQNKAAQTPLHIAIFSGSDEIATMIKKFAESEIVPIIIKGQSQFPTVAKITAENSNSRLSTSFANLTAANTVKLQKMNSTISTKSGFGTNASSISLAVPSPQMMTLPQLSSSTLPPPPNFLNLPPLPHLSGTMKGVPPQMNSLPPIGTMRMNSSPPPPMPSNLSTMFSSPTSLPPITSMPAPPQSQLPVLSSISLPPPSASAFGHLPPPSINSFPLPPSLMQNLPLPKPPTLNISMPPPPLPSNLSIPQMMNPGMKHAPLSPLSPSNSMPPPPQMPSMQFNQSVPSFASLPPPAAPLFTVPPVPVINSMGPNSSYAMAPPAAGAKKTTSAFWDNLELPQLSSESSVGLMPFAGNLQPPALPPMFRNNK